MIVGGLFALLILFAPFGEYHGSLLRLHAMGWMLLAASLIQWSRRGSIPLIHHPLLSIGLLGLAWSSVSTFIAPNRFAASVQLRDLLLYGVILYLVLALEIQRGYLFYLIFFAVLLRAAFGLFRIVTADASPHDPFVNPNVFAGLMALGIAFGVARLFFMDEKALWWAWASALPLFGLFLYLIQSRGAFLAVAATLACYLLAKSRRLFLLVSIILVGLLLLPPVWEALSGWKGEDPVAFERWNIWSMSLAMIGDHPLFGVGLGNYRWFAPQYNFPVEHTLARYERLPLQAHNEMLNFAVEVGLVGLVCGLALLACVVWCGLRTARGGKDRWLDMGIIGGLLALFTQSNFSAILHSPPIALFGAILLGCLMRPFVKKREVPLPSHLLPFILWGIALGIWGSVVNPHMGHRAFLEGQSHEEKGELEKALRAYERAIQQNPYRSVYYKLKGRLLYEQFKRDKELVLFAEAADVLDAAIRLNPQDGRAPVLQALLHEAGFFELLSSRELRKAAERYYGLAVELNPKDVFLRFTIANFYYRFEEMQLAAFHLEQAIRLEPNFAEAHRFLMEVYRQQGEEEKVNNVAKRFQDLRRRWSALPQQLSSYEERLLRGLFLPT